MKKIFLFIILLTASFHFLFAQDEDWTKRERMFREVQEYKMKYLAQEMELTELQKKKFFELYEDMTRSKQECYQGAIEMDRNLKKDKNASEEDYQKVTEAFNQANAEVAEIDKQYNEKFAEFLTQKQIYKMKEAEMEFKRKLGEMRQKRKKDHHGRSRD